MREQGEMTEEEIIELQRQKDYLLKQKYQKVTNEYFEEKFERDKMDLQRKEYERLKQKEKLERKNCTF